MVEILNHIKFESGENSLEDFAASPCEVFLSELDTIYLAVNHCIEHLPKKSDETEQALAQITIAALGTIMGHFELYQRLSFASAFELTRYVAKFDLEKCVRSLEKVAGLKLDISHLSAYRGQPAPIGQLIADSLSSWHSPDTVNLYFNTISSNNKLSFYSNDDIRTIRILWQLRHSFVHTGGWLTLPDAQKNTDLMGKGGKAIFPKNEFTESVAKNLFGICIGATMRLSSNLAAGLPAKVVSSRVFKKFKSTKNNRDSWTPKQVTTTPN
jgi:hypothetical protein